MEIIVKTKPNAIAASAFLTISDKITIARKDKKLIEAEFVEVKAHIKRMMVLLGLSESNYPDTIELDYMTEKYKEIYYRYSIKDIELAIDMALNGTIDHNVNLYDRPFSPAFFSPLLIKYTEYRAQLSRQNTHTNKQNNEPSNFEKWNIMENGVLNLWDKFKAGEAELDDFQWYYFNFLHRDCQVMTTTKSQFQVAQKKAKSLLDIEVKTINQHRRQMLIRQIREAAGENAINDKAKEILLFNYYSELKEMDANLIDMLPENPYKEEINTKKTDG